MKSKLTHLAIVYLLAFALTVYCFLDLYQTKLLFDVGASEANPLMKWVIDVTGTWVSLCVIKVFLIFMLWLGLWLWRNDLLDN